MTCVILYRGSTGLYSGIGFLFKLSQTIVTGEINGLCIPPPLLLPLIRGASAAGREGPAAAQHGAAVVRPPGGGGHGEGSEGQGHPEESAGGRSFIRGCTVGSSIVWSLYGTAPSL